jgi:hypothetical protein
MTHSGYASDDEWGLIMSGGKSDNSIQLNYFVATLDNDTFRELAPQIMSPFDHSLFIIDDDILLITGGLWGTDTLAYKTYIYKRTE